MENSKQSEYDRNLTSLSFDSNVEYIFENIIDIISLKKSPFYLLMDEDAVLEFSIYVYSTLNAHEDKIASLSKEQINFLFYLSSISNCIDLYEMLSKYHEDHGGGKLCFHINHKMKNDEINRAMEMFTFSKWVGNSRLPPEKEDLDFDFTILLGKGLLSIYSVKHDFDDEFDYPSGYLIGRDERYSMLERGRGASKEDRKEIFFQLQKLDKYSDLEAYLDNQLVYLYSKENNEVIFTTNMDYARYLSIMLRHGATRISMCYRDCLWNHEDDYTVSLMNEEKHKPFINMRVIDFSEDLTDFLQSEKELKIEDKILRRNLDRLFPY